MLYVALAATAGALMLMSALHQNAFSLHMQSYGYSLIAIFDALVLALLVSASKNLTAPRTLQWRGVGAYSIYFFHLDFLVMAEKLTTLNTAFFGGARYYRICRRLLAVA